MVKIFLCVFLGAVYRFYESRRRLFNDARPERIPIVKSVKSKLKKVERRRKVCHIFVVLTYFKFKLFSSTQKEKKF